MEPPITELLFLPQARRTSFNTEHLMMHSLYTYSILSTMESVV